MVTEETTKDIFFALEDCVLCKFIELVTKFLPLPPRIYKINKPSKDILKYSPIKEFPLLKTGDDFISGTLSIVKYLIKSSKDESNGIILDNRRILLGNNLKEEAKVDTWINFIINSIVPICSEIEGQLKGKKKFNSAIFENAKKDLLEVLGIVNEKLQLNTFLTSNNIQLSDLMLASVLFNCYNEVLIKEKIDKIPNVIRLFKYVSRMKPFVDIFGKAKECSEITKSQPSETKGESSKKGKKDKKKDKGKEEIKKEDNKKGEIPKEEPPKKETPKEKPPKKETPKEEPPKEEIKKEETPKEEKKEETPKETTNTSGGQKEKKRKKKKK